MLADRSQQKELADLLSQIIGEDIHENRVSHKFLFITVLVTLLLGVMYADGQATESEKEHIKQVIREFIPPKSYVGQLIKPIFAGVKANKSYTNAKIISSLVNGFTDSEKLLVISLCHEIAAVDGEVAAKEDKYIRGIAKILNIDNRHLSYVLGDSAQQGTDSEALSDIRQLLDPHHFQNLDPALMRAADILRAKLPDQSENQTSGTERKLSYQQLSEFQQRRNQLSALVNELHQLIEQGIEQDILSAELKEQTAQAYKKIRSQRFRLAVVGEFSQGKSTVLNALLGEEIQPVRAIPCSGTVTVLKHGEERRVICRYSDRPEEEVPIDQYQELASISQDAALSNIANELSKSTLQEIVFEHPGLDLCRHQVEIVDSPGLNEHPDRTAITHQLLKDTDAAIFLANASRPFTQGEIELLDSLRQQLQGGAANQPADNLFVLVNFMDLLQRKQDREHVKLRASNCLHGETPLITGTNRLHFISAQAALNAMLEGDDNEYLHSFRDFVQAIQVFLTQERGALVMRQSNEQVTQLIQKARIELKQSTQLLDGEIAFSESEKHQIIEQMGMASGRDVQLCILRNRCIDDALEAISEAWGEWLSGIADRLAAKSVHWESGFDEKEKILRDYAGQFSRDCSNDLDNWLESVVKRKILLPRIRELDQIISENLEAIYQDLKSIDSNSGSNLSEQFNLSLSQFGVDMRFGSNLNANAIEDEDDSLGLFFAGGGIVGGGLAILGFSFFPILLAGAATGAIVGWLFGTDPEELKQKMKQEVYIKGIEKLQESLDQIGEKIAESSIQALEARTDRSSQAIREAISILDQILKQQEIAHQKTVSSNSEKKEFIRIKMTELVDIESRIQSLLSSFNR
jgi:uncharacterized tellurite resistance protein B-like protein/tRNA U34 5-carboxymethylaminomethyl modifying GTPase MnmE/TrmE